MPDVVCLGEALIDFVSTAPVASVADAPAFVPAAGGAPANAAVALARLGIATGFVGKIGDDPFGRHLARTFEANGVDTSRLRFDQSARTALAFVALDDTGHPDFVFFRHPSADMLLRRDDLDPAYLTSARALHTGSIALAAEPCRSTVVEAMRLTRAAGRLVCLDPNVRVSLWGSVEEMRRVLLPIVALADIVKLSEEDLAALVGTGRPEYGAAVLLGRGPQLVVVTRGEHGCFCQSTWGALTAPAYRVPVVDTTGAGDAFAGALITGLLALGATRQNLSTLGAPELLAALRLANAAGALTTTARGAIPALPDRTALRRFLAEQGETAALALIE